jgi:hypothetical protein
MGTVVGFHISGLPTTRPSGSVNSRASVRIYRRLVVRRGYIATYREPGKHFTPQRPPRCMVSDNAATPANHDARAALTCVESRASGRVHRLDRCSGFDTGQSTHSRSLAFDLSLRSRLAGIKALFSHDCLGGHRRSYRSQVPHFPYRVFGQLSWYALWEVE